MPRSSLAPGLRGEVTVMVCEHNVAPHVPVFSTPSLVELMERICVATVEGHLSPDETTVGYEVFVRHMAPTPLGMKVKASCQVTEVKDNHVYFRAEMYDEEKKVGEGTHKRAIVPRSFGST